MSADFEQHFSRLGLAALPADVSCEATFASGIDPTLASGPRAELTRLEAGTAGTFPKLALATPDAARAGSAEGELEVLDVLGEGGMGQVLLARQHSLGREVAVKVLKAGQLHPGSAEALVEEARTTGSLEHPGVVPVYALARDSRGLPALVMKRVDGVSWRGLLQDPAHPAWERIARGRDRLEANLEVLIQVCTAVAHAHQRGVIHRDLKPANVLIGELGEVYVADWGVAIQKANLAPGPPRLVGTPAYLAPEMVIGDPTLTDERTDVYLLGGTLHEVLTRRPPHPGASLHDVLQRAWAAAAPSLPPEVPAELAAVCTRALAADPRARFQSALEVRDALRTFLGHRGALQLSSAAAIRLTQLEAMAKVPLAAPEERGWYGLVSECRFGFAQALEADPTSAVARAGHERCLEVATTRELARGAAAAARAFLAEMNAPPAALEQQLRALEAKDAQRSEREERFKQLTHENDPLVSARQRNAVILALAVIVTGVVAVFGFSDGPRAWFESRLGKWASLVPMSVVSLAYGLLLAVGRKALLATRINRQMMAVIGVGCVSIWLSRVQFVHMDLSLSASLVHDAWMMAAMMVVCSFIVHWSFAVPGLVFLLGGVGVTLSEGRHPAGVFSALSAVGLVTSVLMFQRWRKELEREGPQ